MKPTVATHDDCPWLLSRAVEVDRDDILLLLADAAWCNSGDDAFNALNRMVKQAGLGQHP